MRIATPLINWLWGESALHRQIAHGATGTFVLKVFNVGVTFLTAILLARLLGTHGYGVYAYAMSWVTLLGVLVKLGLDQVITRNIAIYRDTGDYARMRGLLQFAFVATGLASLVSLLGAAAIVALLYRQHPEMLIALWLALALLPLDALMVPLAATQRGLQQITRAQLPSLFVKPLLFISLVGGIAFVAPDLHSAKTILALYLLATAFCVIVASLLLRQGLRISGVDLTRVTAVFEIRSWLTSALPLVLMGSMFIVNMNADIFMLGMMAGTEAAGIYKAATRGAELIVFMLPIMEAPLSPVIARLYALGDLQTLQRAITTSARISVVAALLIAVSLILFGQWFLLLFGEGFTAGHTTLKILSVGQLLNAIAGPVWLVLVMTGHGGKAAAGAATGAAANVVLNAALIPIWGINGAAIATAISTALWNGVCLFLVVRCVHMDPTFIGIKIGDKK